MRLCCREHTASQGTSQGTVAPPTPPKEQQPDTLQKQSWVCCRLSRNALTARELRVQRAQVGYSRKVPRLPRERTRVQGWHGDGPGGSPTPARIRGCASKSLMHEATESTSQEAVRTPTLALPQELTKSAGVGGTFGEGQHC